jgi:hypothetical protein
LAYSKNPNQAGRISLDRAGASVLVRYDEDGQPAELLPQA